MKNNFFFGGAGVAGRGRERGLVCMWGGGGVTEADGGRICYLHVECSCRIPQRKKNEVTGSKLFSVSHHFDFLRRHIERPTGWHAWNVP